MNLKQHFGGAMHVAIASAFCFFLASTGSAKAEAPAEKLDSQELVVGDWYEVTVEKGGVKEQAEGTLVQVTDDWMVLGVVCCAGGDEPRFPLIGKWLNQYLDCFIGVDIFDLDDLLPVELPPRLNKLVRQRKGFYYKHYVWIHRQLAKIDSRQRVENAAVRKNFAGDVPTLKIDGSVYQIVDGKKTSTDGESIRAEDHQLKLVNTRWETKDVGNPTWSEVPLLGYLFVKEKVTKIEDVSAVPMESVFYISQHVPYDYWKVHAGEKAGAN